MKWTGSIGGMPVCLRGISGRDENSSAAGIQARLIESTGEVMEGRLLEKWRPRWKSELKVPGGCAAPKRPVLHSAVLPVRMVPRLFVRRLLLFLTFSPSNYLRHMPAPLMHITWRTSLDAAVVPDGYGANFRVWAPRALRVHLVSQLSEWKPKPPTSSPTMLTAIWRATSRAFRTDHLTSSRSSALAATATCAIPTASCASAPLSVIGFL